VLLYGALKNAKIVLPPLERDTLSKFDSVIVSYFLCLACADQLLAGVREVYSSAATQIHKSTWSKQIGSRCFVFALPILQAGDQAFRLAAARCSQRSEGSVANLQAGPLAFRRGAMPAKELNEIMFQPCKRGSELTNVRPLVCLTKRKLLGRVAVSKSSNSKQGACCHDTSI
jgi:hypothetical protein